MEPLSEAGRQPSGAEESGFSLIQAPGADGPWNMALDEAIARLSPAPALRVYAWPRGEATFGYAQSHSAARALAPDVPLTRRLTGGGLVRHGADLTLTIFIPRGVAAFPDNIRAGYRFLHGLLRDTLRLLGVEAVLSPDRPPGPVCFEAPVCDDLILPGPGGAVKIAGGAQRRLREGLLHQGSLNTPLFPPEADNAARLAQAFAAALAAALGRGPVRARPPLDAELSLAETLAAGRYGSPVWTALR